MWSLSYTYETKPSPSNRPQLFEPYYNASAIVAVSPSLPADTELTLTAIEHEHNPGSLVIHLQDASGKPAFGYVCLDRFMLEPHFAGSTDENGEIRFAAVTATMPDVPVEAYEPAAALPAIDQPGNPFPSDKELIGRTAIFSEKIKCPVDIESHLTIRPKPVGYVRGVVRPAAGMTAADYLDRPRLFDRILAARREPIRREDGSISARTVCRRKFEFEFAMPRFRQRVARLCVEARSTCIATKSHRWNSSPRSWLPAAPANGPAAKDVLRPPQYISIGRRRSVGFGPTRKADRGDRVPSRWPNSGCGSPSGDVRPAIGPTGRRRHDRFRWPILALGNHAVDQRV